MITAVEARKISKSNPQEEEELNKIFKQIKLHAERGLYSCIYDGYIWDRNKEVLKKLGYDLDLESSRGDYEIKW